MLQCLCDVYFKWFRSVGRCLIDIGHRRGDAKEKLCCSLLLYGVHAAAWCCRAQTRGAATQTAFSCECIIFSVHMFISMTLE